MRRTTMGVSLLGNALAMAVLFSGDAIGTQRVISASDAPRFGVMPFRDTTQIAKEEKYGEAVAAMLTTELMRERNIRVVEKEELIRILEEQRFSLSGLTDRYLEAGKLMGIDVAIVGAVSVLGDPTVVQYPPAMVARRVQERSMEVDVRAVNLVTGEIIHSWSFSTQKPSDELRVRLREIARLIVSGYLKPITGTIAVRTSSDAAVYYRVATGKADQVIPSTQEIPLQTFVPLRSASQTVSGTDFLSEPILQGEYDVLAIRPGHMPQHARLTVTAGQTSRWIPSFTLARTTLTLTGLPAQSEVLLMGQSPWNSDWRIRIRFSDLEGARVTSLDGTVDTPRTEVPVRVTASTETRTLSIADLPSGTYDCRLAVYGRNVANVRQFAAVGRARLISVPRWPITVSIDAEEISGSRVRIFVRPENLAALPEHAVYLDDTYIGILGDPGEAEITGISEGIHQLRLVPIRIGTGRVRTVTFTVKADRSPTAVYVE